MHLHAGRLVQGRINRIVGGGGAWQGDQCSADGGVVIGVVREACKHIGVGRKSEVKCLCRVNG